MRFFKEIDVATVCYPIEAVDWLVRGLPPEFWADDNGNEVRGNLRALRKEYYFEQEILSPADLKNFGIELSHDEYLNLLYGEEDEVVFANVDPLPIPVDHEELDRWLNERKTIRAERERLAETRVRTRSRVIART